MDIRSILAGQTNVQEPQATHSAAPSFSTLVQSPFSAASLTSKTGMFLQHIVIHCPQRIHFVSITSPSRWPFGSFTLSLSLVAFGAPTLSSTGHVRFIITRPRIDAPKKLVNV